MTEYALSTNLHGLASIRSGFIEWPSRGAEAELIREMRPGDLVVPKFAQSPGFALAGEEGLAWQRKYCEALGIDPDEIQAEYQELIAGGARAVPYILSVTRVEHLAPHPTGDPWDRGYVEVEQLPHPLNTQEFLRLRAVPQELSAQFKAMAPRGRHLQEIPAGTAAAVREAGSTEDREHLLRRYSVVEAATADSAASELAAAGRSPIAGDRVFIAAAGGLLGVHDVGADSLLVPVGAPIPRSPQDVRELFEAARLRMVDSDPFAHTHALAAANELVELIESPANVIEIDNFQRFHDRYVLLSKRVTQALEIARRPLPTTAPTPVAPEEEEEEGEGEVEIEELEALMGLDIEAVRAALPPEMELADSVLAEAVTALRSGKHLLLSGPPGTGKTTLAEALARAVLADHYNVATATADWTTFDTIGGYMPSENEMLSFEPGIVLRSLQRGRWLIIDEINRADIDKAFGPLFTLLAGAGGGDGSARSIVLPFQEEGQNIEVVWAETRTGAKSKFVLTPGWRLLGTLNVRDKASLFQLSFAFLRRFAVVDVPLPEATAYRAWFEARCSEVPEEARPAIVDTAVALAYGPREIGPAILKDIARFVTVGLTETASGNPNYADPIEAFLTAVRLYVVPQYEGASPSETHDALGILRAHWPDRPEESWSALVEAFSFVAV